MLLKKRNQSAGLDSVVVHVIVVSLHFPRGSSALGLTNISVENMGWRMLSSLNPYGIR